MIKIAERTIAAKVQGLPGSAAVLAFAQLLMNG